MATGKRLMTLTLQRPHVKRFLRAHESNKVMDQIDFGRLMPLATTEKATEAVKPEEIQLVTSLTFLQKPSKTNIFSVAA
jgi:hypothetical protein